MASGERRKCKGCHKLFRPDPRNRHHQRYCAAQSCRAASKAASQARWLAAPENRDYFRGPANVARVKAWRSHHPGYWRKRRRDGVALQDLSLAQPIDLTNKTINFAGSALQDLLLAQPAILIGLIAHIVATPLQDDIVRTTGRLLRLGHDARCFAGLWRGLDLVLGLDIGPPRQATPSVAPPRPRRGQPPAGSVPESTSPLPPGPTATLHSQQKSSASGAILLLECRYVRSASFRW